ncbi:hypothetical protein RHMOL_Rhmol02G0231800 [Rhododendron molle]|uniref:Uncharacterized protein n=1 Tax=Rhododendron molle TaxID=49168 RepID=A0ACC0PVP7_RHOML|nr:hypothetical protein RHMOL_Rhmol02G0231800 [Rhododendron molle]
MKRTRPTFSARKREADETSTSEVGEVGGRGRRQRQKKVGREAGEEENRPGWKESTLTCMVRFHNPFHLTGCDQNMCHAILRNNSPQHLK